MFVTNINVLGFPRETDPCVCVCVRVCVRVLRKKNLPSQHILKYIKYHIDIYSHMCGRALELIHLASLKPYIC